MSRESLLTRTFVQLADTLVDDFDIVDLLTTLTRRCAEALDVSAAGLMLATPKGDFRVVASSSEEMHLVELFEVQSQEGPCFDCFHTRLPVLNQLLGGTSQRWPRRESPGVTEEPGWARFGKWVLPDTTSRTPIGFAA